MLVSMTGFGRSVIDCQKFSYEIEIKSVNSRYLDISVKLCQNLIIKEYELREFIKSKFNRGKISLIISQKKNINEKNENYYIDYDKLRNTLSLIKEIKKAAKLRDKIKIDHILSYKEIFYSPADEISEEEFEKIKEGISKVADELIAMKRKEGAELEKDITSRIKNIELKVNEIEKLSSDSLNEYFNNYKLRVKQLLDERSSEFYDDRLRLELALLTEKSDISEECVRLKSHLKFFLDAMKNENQPGRKLNFLCQEIHREANTISSKTLSKDITYKVIEIKEEVERIREQIQNVE
ncbi:MAG: YicC family protein [Ignavibacterium sp.]|nr:YicC family protein [Ignavibacterium sp.]MCX7612369.1 YicC family protein [Ignavibacterium sp.]MDW8374720.1 YicC/YloC family endoribonuclease [Ignavibacteriales bacterium]